MGSSNVRPTIRDIDIVDDIDLSKADSIASANSEVVERVGGTSQ